MRETWEGEREREGRGLKSCASFLSSSPTAAVGASVTLLERMTCLWTTCRRRPSTTVTTLKVNNRNTRGSLCRQQPKSRACAAAACTRDRQREKQEVVLAIKKRDREALRSLRAGHQVCEQALVEPHASSPSFLFNPRLSWVP